MTVVRRQPQGNCLTCGKRQRVRTVCVYCGAFWLMRRPLLDRNVAPVGHDHPETSKQAAAKALPSSGEKRRMTYVLLRDNPGGWTSYEVGAHFDWPHQSFSSLVCKMAQDGWLVVIGKRLSPLGNPAGVYDIADR